MVWMVIQCQFEIIVSCPRCRNIIAGIRLIMKAYEMVVFTYCG